MERGFVPRYCVNKWSEAKEILDQNPNASTASLNDERRTALHVAAMFGHVTIVKELLELLPPEFLTTLDAEGYTALALACWYSGSTRVAKCLVNKNSNILGIPNKNKNLPVKQAFANNYIEMGRYLYSVTPLECLTGPRGSELLHICFKAQCLDIALDLLQRCELLLVIMDDEGWTPIHDIASLNTAILSPSDLVFWKRWIYNCMNKPSTIAINHVCVDVQQEDRSQEDKAKLTQPGHGLLSRPITSTYNFVGVKKLQELMLQHAQADDLLGLVCKNARKAYQKGVLYEALILAAKEGNAEFVFQVSKVIPEIFARRTFLQCFKEAIDNRQVEVFNLIHGLQFKSVVLNSRISGDTMLHRAATKAPDHILNRIYAPTLRMQKELQWFKEVESLMPLAKRGLQNSNGKTGEELFRESHRELMKEGEKWIKATASSCSVVATLIMTIMFAAAFTVPGGNDQNLGYPLFVLQPFFKVFIFSTIFSLLSSSTSVLMFLAILTFQYSEEKFLKSLPLKLIWVFLFFSYPLCA